MNSETKRPGAVFLVFIVRRRTEPERKRGEKNEEIKGRQRFPPCRPTRHPDIHAVARLWTKKRDDSAV
ncbi:unnamed protein product [Menidia menidia]|uniref:(Atlantic silverside) hypothetical protein n=1 Tax=Menidia menidia TaxID=238744 RepID=A0A8S4C0G7_9TELE|nr:unnamed protein product [Menidia menidia]